jgi:hypothetical protein
MARPNKNLTQFQIWFEEAWEGWIRPLGAMLLLAVGYLLYKFDILTEQPAGALAVLAVVVGSIGTGFAVALPLARQPWQRAMLFTLAAAALLGTLYSPLHTVLPGAPLAKGTMTSAQPKLTLTTGRSGPYDVTVSGHFKDAGRSDADSSYDLKITDNGGGSDEIAGAIERQNVVIRSRKGSSSSLEEHNEATYRLPDVRGPTVTFNANDGVDDQLDGLTVTLHKGGLNPIIFIVLGALALAMALVLDTRLVDLKGKQKSYLTAAVAVAFAFSLRYPLYATSLHLVGPAVSELLWALVVGGLSGWAVGGLARLWFGPKLPKTKARSTR